MPIKSKKVCGVSTILLVMICTSGCLAPSSQSSTATVPVIPEPPTMAAPSSDDVGISAAMSSVSSNNEWEPYIVTINGVEMGLVPAGCFQMGTEDGDARELPVHEVCFDEPFWIDVYEVTNGQYGSSGSWAGDELPRENVSWSEALAHCERRGARLPTEAEWEYAARGPDGLVYPWGNEPDGTMLNSCDTNCLLDWLDSNTDDGYQNTAPVGSYLGGVSWIGAYDLAGNLWEWVNDWYGEEYYGTLTNGVVNPLGPEFGTYRVIRGSAWSDSGFLLRAAHRYRALPEVAIDSNGFRCALSLSSSQILPDGDLAAGIQTTNTPEATEEPRGETFSEIEGVSSNDEWEPYIRTINGVEMAQVPAGCFQMGELHTVWDEQPEHWVCFDEPFWIDVYEVTNEQYGSTGCEDCSSDPYQPRGNVSWNEALAYCESRGARLPTEAEWEYAARGPDSLAYPWGNEFDGSLANFCDTNCLLDWLDSNTDDGYENMAPVGSYPDGVSWVGVYDLAGNVGEWVNDWYDEEYYGTLTNGVVNPKGPNAATVRVWRGGGWFDNKAMLRSANRHSLKPEMRLTSSGFRCALTFPP